MQFSGFVVRHRAGPRLPDNRRGRRVMISETAFNNLLNRVEALEHAVETPPETGQEQATEQKTSDNWEMSWGGRVMVDYVTWADQDIGYGGGKTGENYLERGVD